MKKLAAILLLVILLFNMAGYRGWFYVAERQWEAQLQNSLDKEQYNEADLITIRAPLLLPYVTDTREFQRTDGEVKVAGVIYHYVKSKIENGEYVLQCLPNKNKQQLEKAKEDFFKEANDILQNGSSKKGNSKAGVCKNILPEYNFNQMNFSRAIGDCISFDYNIQRNGNLLSAPHLSPLQPPELS